MIFAQKLHFTTGKYYGIWQNILNSATGQAGEDSKNLSVDPSACNNSEAQDGVIVCLDGQEPKSNAGSAALSVLTGLFVCALH